MHSIALYLTRVALFVLGDRIFLKQFRKKKQSLSWFDAEVIFAAGLAAALLTMAVMKTLFLNQSSLLESE